MLHYTSGTMGSGKPARDSLLARSRSCALVVIDMVAIFCPFGLFCEINISLLSLQTQPNTAPNLFQRGVEYGKYDRRPRVPEAFRRKPFHSALKYAGRRLNTLCRVSFCFAEAGIRDLQGARF